MQSTIYLNFNSRPSTFKTVLHALFGYTKKFNSNKSFVRVVTTRKDLSIDMEHLNAFNKICEVNSSDVLTIMYPFTIIYPFIQRILAHKKTPLSIINALNTRMQVHQYRKIYCNEILDVSCELSEVRIREKGLELDILSCITIAEEKVWENIQTFYYRGSYGNADKNYKPQQFSPIKNPHNITSRVIPGSKGYNFSKILGDGNPIHYSKKYARIFGFKSDFAQPLLYLTKCVEDLAHNFSKKTISVDILLKGQLYYEKNIQMKSSTENDVIRFDILCEGDILPSIYGKLE